MRFRRRTSWHMWREFQLKPELGPQLLARHLVTPWRRRRPLRLPGHTVLTVHANCIEHTRQVKAERKAKVLAAAP